MALQQGRACWQAAQQCLVAAVPTLPTPLRHLGLDSVSLAGSPAAVQREAAGNPAALFWERAGAPGCLAAAEISAPLVSTLFFSSPLMIRQSSVITQSSEPRMVHLRVLIAAAVTLKWDLAINHVHWSPLMPRPAFSLPIVQTGAGLLDFYHLSLYPPCHINPFSGFLAQPLSDKARGGIPLRPCFLPSSSLWFFN